MVAIPATFNLAFVSSSNWTNNPPATSQSQKLRRLTRRRCSCSQSGNEQDPLGPWHQSLNSTDRKVDNVANRRRIEGFLQYNRNCGKARIRYIAYAHMDNARARG